MNSVRGAVLLILLILSLGGAGYFFREHPDAWQQLVSKLSFQSTPSERAGRAVFEHDMKAKLGDVPFEIESFQKTNGEMVQDNVYLLEYSATVRYPEGFHPECVGNSGDFKGWGCMFVMADSLSPGAVTPKSPGDTEIRKGRLVFEKTERGWRGEDGNLY